MFNTKKFGGYLSKLRKETDITQSELANKLMLTRQAISSYERGDSFPDVSILVLIADIFGVSLDDLINSGEPTRGEAIILGSIAVGNENVVAQSISDIAGLAPLLKPSILGKLSNGLTEQGIDITNIVQLAEYLSDDTVVKLLESATLDSISDELLEKLIPFLDDRSKGTIFQKILDGEMDWHLIKILVPYAVYMMDPIEAAVIEGALPWEALAVLKDGFGVYWEKQLKNDEIW